MSTRPIVGSAGLCASSDGGFQRKKKTAAVPATQQGPQSTTQPSLIHGTDQAHTTSIQPLPINTVSQTQLAMSTRLPQVSETKSEVSPSTAKSGTAAVSSVPSTFKPNTPTGSQLNPSTSTPYQIRGGNDSEPIDSTSYDSDELTEDEVMGGVYVDRAMLEQFKQLSMEHEQCTELIQQAEKEQDKSKKEVRRLEKEITRLDEERSKENAQSHAECEQLRSDLSYETSRHSHTMKQLAQAANGQTINEKLQATTREKNMLQASLTHHERELHSSTLTIKSLQERLETVEAMNQQQEDQLKSASQEIFISDDSNQSGEYKSDVISNLIELPADTPSSKLIPALSSSSAPIHLRRTQLNSLLLYRNISHHKMQRLESELARVKNENENQLKEIEKQWKELELVKQEFHSFEREKKQFEQEAKTMRDGGILGGCKHKHTDVTSFTATASTSALILQLQAAETRVERLEQSNAIFTRRFYWKLFFWLLILMTLTWFMTHG